MRASATLNVRPFFMVNREGPVMEVHPDRPDTLGTEAEIAHLRERLAFYESFDQVIRENVSQSSTLLRKAADTREETQRVFETANADRARIRSVERSQFRVLFATMLDEVTTLQGQLERLARRVADSLDDLETDHPLASIAAAAAPAGELAEGDYVVTAPAAPEAEATAPGVTSEDFDASSPAEDEPEGVLPFSADDYVTGVRVVETSELPLPGEPEAEPAPEVAEAPAVLGATVLVHGVPRATTALSLKRFIENLADVEQVEPREYAEGVLRLLVSSRRPITIDDLRSWSEGAALEPINVRDDLLEVRLGR